MEILPNDCAGEEVIGAFGFGLPIINTSGWFYFLCESQHCFTLMYSVVDSICTVIGELYYYAAIVGSPISQPSNQSDLFVN